MRFGGVADEFADEIRHGFFRIRAEPAVFRIVAENGCAFRRAQESSPLVQQSLDVRIDFPVDKCGPSADRRHRPVQNRVERESDEPVLGIRRRMRQNHVEEPEHVLIVPDLRQPRRRCGFPFRHFAEHLIEEHVRFRVVLNKILQLLDHRFQRTGILFRFFHDSGHPAAQCVQILRHPFAGGKCFVHRLDCCAHKFPLFCAVLRQCCAVRKVFV